MRWLMTGALALMVALPTQAAAQTHEGGGGFLWSVTAGQAFGGLSAFAASRDRTGLAVASGLAMAGAMVGGPLLAMHRGDSLDPRPPAALQLGFFGGLASFAAAGLLRGDVDRTTWLLGVAGALAVAPLGLAVDREKELFPVLLPFLVLVGFPVAAVCSGLFLVALASDAAARGFGVAWATSVFGTAAGVGVHALRRRGPQGQAPRVRRRGPRASEASLRVTPTGLAARF